MSETETLLQEIYARTQLMIDSSLNNLVLTLALDQLSGITDLMRSDLDSDWRNIHSQLITITRKVFKASCWDNYNKGPEHFWTHIEPSADCDHWRIAGGGSKAIILEIRFVELLIATDLELRRRNLISYLKDTLLVASDLTWQHAQRWKTCRSKFKGFRGDIQSGWSDGVEL